MKPIRWKKTALDALMFFGVLMAGCWFGFFLSQPFKLLAALATDNDKLVEWWFWFVSWLIFMLSLCFFVPFFTERKREQFMPLEIGLSALFACLVQLLLSVLIDFTIYTCGPALPIAQILYAGGNLGQGMLDTDFPEHVYVLCMLGLDVLYIGTAILGGHLGQKQRTKDRKQLYSEAAPSDRTGPDA